MVDGSKLSSDNVSCDDVREEEGRLILEQIMRRNGKTDTMPAHLTTLSVSWFSNQFAAVAVHRGKVEGTWKKELEGQASTFEDLISEAVQQTGYRGQTVSLVLAHPRLVQQLIELPPIKKSLLGKLVRRQAQQQKFFPGEAAWAYQVCISTKKSQRVILHLFPRMLLNQFIHGCKTNGLHLTTVLPPSAVLHRQMSQLPLGKEDIALAAAETGGSTTVAIGRSDGQILLARSLPGTWNDELERLGLDLNRTILFIQQQYGLAINKGLWLFGPGAAELRARLRIHVQLPVNISPVNYHPFYWATEALKLRPRIGPNLISLELQQAPIRRVFARVVAASTMLTVAGALGTAAYCSFQARQEAANIGILSRQAAHLETRQRQLRLIDDELSRKRELIELVIDNQQPPVPMWLLGYLGEAVPPELVVTNVQVKREAESWKVHLAGTAQQSGKELKTSPSPASLALLEENLKAGPFRFKLPGTNGEFSSNAGKETPKGGGMGWLNRWTSLAVSREPSSLKALDQQRFVIEGEIR